MYYSAEGYAIMGMWAGMGNDDQSSKPNGAGRPSWWLILLVILFPIPFSPWWLTIICVALFVVMLVLLMPRPMPCTKNSADQRADRKSPQG
jgi:cytochrome c biogenesis protein ResB